MNIFILDENPVLAAQYHMDKHVIKMPLEMAQMLCTNIYMLNDLTSKAKAYKDMNKLNKIFGGFPPPKSSPYPFYLMTHANHPCTIWLRESKENTVWGLKLFRALLDEYTFRYEKIRDLEKVYDWLKWNYPNHLFNLEYQTPFVQAIENKSLHNENPVVAYRSYYLTEKRHLAKWKKRNIPDWWE